MNRHPNGRRFKSLEFDPSSRTGEPLWQLFCFPCAGGTASFYHNWHNEFPGTVKIIPVQLPGRGERNAEQPFTAIVPLIIEIYQELSHHFHGKYAFFGHSMGALIAFELARYLENQSRQTPACLFISGCEPPYSVADRPRLCDIPDDRLIERLAQLGGTPPEILSSNEFMKEYLPLMRADLTILETYRYQSGPALTCPIFVFGGRQDPLVRREHLVQWQQMTQSTCHVRVFQGDHFYLIARRQDLLGTIGRELLSLNDDAFLCALPPG